MITQKWHLIDVLKEATVFLKTKSIENPRLNAEQLLGHALGLSRVDLYLQFDRPLNQEEREAYKALLRRRANHEPLQYIVGKTEFMSLLFRVTSEVLIPRPETEVLVERIIEETAGKIRILDIGVGSGNIAVALAKLLTRAEIVGVDSEERALALAIENAKQNNVEERILFLRADVMEEEFCQKITGLFDVIVSNPPYVSLKEWDTLPKEIRGFEPKKALCDGGDGLTFFRIIAQKGKKILRTGGKLFFEAGNRQSKKIQTLLKESEYENIAAFPDLNGIERVVRGVWQKETPT